ncbi:MAG: metal-dependent hydrolase [Chloroflexota bacterium]
MQTYSHFIITSVLRRPLKQWSWGQKNLPPLRVGGLLLGSIMPDFLLTINSIAFIAYDLARGINIDPGNPNPESLTTKLFDDWFFNNPWVIAEQQVLHSPLLVLIYMLVGYWLWKSQRSDGWGAWIFWFASACMLHTLIDIPIHYDDGPLLLFPFNWDLRFMSPVSYWDPERYGIPFIIFEHTLDLVLIGFIVYTSRHGIADWFRRRFLQRS